VDKKVQEGHIQVKIIIEVAGFPEEHITKTMKLISAAIEKEKIEVITSKIHPTKKASEKFWATFIEVEFLVKKLSTLISFIFDYMPSSIEIIRPEGKIAEDAEDLMIVLNDLTSKLHSYARGMKKAMAENNILKKEIQKIKEGKK